MAPYSTFHPSNMNLGQQYQMYSMKKYFELITGLLVAEQHNEVLRKTYQSSSTSPKALPEASAITLKISGCGHGHSHVYGCT